VFSFDTCSNPTTIIGADKVDGVSNLKVSATLINTGDESVKLLNDPRTVLNKAPTNSFAISNTAGASPVFQGMKVKYLPETAARIGGENAFTVLAPGESVTIEHDRA
jgi:peptidyl-Lys metalloendopeptidase